MGLMEIEAWVCRNDGLARVVSPCDVAIRFILSSISKGSCLVLAFLLLIRPALASERYLDLFTYFLHDASYMFRP